MSLGTPSRFATPDGTKPNASGPEWILGQRWTQQRFRQPGWLILPLRGFLAVTFVFAALQKLANPAYLNPHNPASVVGQMQSLRHTSPIGPLLGISLHAPTLVGLLIALGELAVGTGALLGLWTRAAALGGMLLSLTFFLTVSWSTTPYYYGSDIVFFFAWSVLAGLGADGVLSIDAWLDHAAAIRPARRTIDIERRRRLLALQATGLVALAAGGLGGATALIGRLAGGTDKTTTARNPLTARSPSPRSPRSSPRATAKPKSAPGTAIASVSALSVGQAGQFTDPKTGQPAWLVHPAANKFVAFSAVCTHAGCTVGFDGSSMEFVCPCHGGTYNATTGAVVAGPPPSPLPAIPVHVVNNTVRVD